MNGIGGECGQPGAMNIKLDAAFGAMQLRLAVRLYGDHQNPDAHSAGRTGLYLPQGMYTPLEYDIRLFLDETHFVAGTQNASQARFQGRCNITFAVEKSSSFIWIHAAPSMRFLQAGLVLHDRGSIHDGTFPETPVVLCLRYMGIPSYTPDCSRIMERTG